MREEKSAPGFKAFKNRFTLLLGANLVGDCKLKPVMVYHAENPCALKGYDKGSLPVHWYTNSIELDDGTHFPSVQQGCFGARFEGVLHDSGPPLPYPDSPQQRSRPSPHFADLHSDIKFDFLPPNTTSLLQPMDKGVIQMLKTHYLQKMWCAFSLKCL